MVNAGFDHTDTADRADVIVINTCAFIEPAVRESIDTILDYREDNPDANLIVVGCLTDRYGRELETLLPEVNHFVGLDRIGDIPGLALGMTVTESRSRDASAPSPCRVRTTPGYAYLKIAEGCSRRCGYCTIPSIRGNLRSEDPSVLEAEARRLVSEGVSELIPVAQDLTAYGTDRGLTDGLVLLLRELERIPGLHWIRLMYLHPAGITDGLVQTVRNSKVIVPYLDVPFQHVSAKVLKAMGRPWKGEPPAELVARLRASIPGLTLRTTLMMGFPGEGEAEFEELVDFVEQTEIDRVGVFPYYAEDGTPASKLGDPVPPDVKSQRVEIVETIHSQQLERRNRSRIGTVEPCIVEGLSEETDLLLQGRLRDQAPEVDGVLYITEGIANPGDIRDVFITEVHQTDLFGRLTP